MFDFRLKVFFTVAQKLSFTKASQELFITQPAVTKHVHELESQLGQTLFERRGKEIELTQAGKILFDYCKRIFELYDELEFELAQLKGKTEGQLRLGASTTLAQYILPGSLAEFSGKYDKVRLSLIEGNTGFIEQQLQDDKIDLAFIEGYSRKPFLHYTPFIEDELVLVTKYDNDLAGNDKIDLDQLLTLPLVVREFGSGTLEIIQHALQQRQIKPDQLNIVMRLGATEGIKHYLLHSDSFAFVSLHAVKDEVQQKRLKIITIEGFRIHRTLQFVHSQGMLSSLAEMFLKFCKSYYKIK